MKRRSLHEAIHMSWCKPWTVCAVIFSLCFVSFSCRNETNPALKTSTTNQDSIPQRLRSQAKAVPSEVIASDEVLKEQYKNIIAAVKAKPAYSLFAEFLERGNYMTVFMRPGQFEYTLLVPSDVALKTLDNAKFSQLIYPELTTQENLNFLFKHVGFGFSDPNIKSPVRMMNGKSVVLDEAKNILVIDGKKQTYDEEVSLKPSTKLYFINNLLD